MKHILYILILLGFMSVASADVGDVYYCQSSKIVMIKEGSVEEFSAQQFNFKRNEKELVFGKGGYFSETIKPLTHSIDEWFRGNDELSGGYIDYRDGKFGYASYNFVEDRTLVIMASCDTFE